MTVAPLIPFNYGDGSVPPPNNLPRSVTVVTLVLEQDPDILIVNHKDDYFRRVTFLFSLGSVEILVLHS